MNFKKEALNLFRKASFSNREDTILLDSLSTNVLVEALYQLHLRLHRKREAREQLEKALGYPNHDFLCYKRCKQFKKCVSCVIDEQRNKLNNPEE
mgnify:FL=1